jgi:hypothetical protein
MITLKCSLELMWKVAVFAKLGLLCRQLPEFPEVNRKYIS